MDSLILSSAGFSLDSVLVPAFQLRVGECVCLHLPQAMLSSQFEQLIGVLTGKTPIPGVQLFGRVSWAAPLRNHRHGLLGLFRPMNVADWLSQIAGASPEQVQAILEKIKPRKGTTRIAHLAWTPRTMLSVEAAWLPRADAVVFTTIGLDPLGREALFQAVSSHFHHGSAIHLSFPFLQEGQRRHHCFAGTTCLELAQVPESPRSTTIRPGSK